MPVVGSGRISPGTGQITYSGEASATGISQQSSSSQTSSTLRLTGDVTGAGWPTIETSLTFTGVTPGTYTVTTLVVDAKGRITYAENGIAGGSGTSTTVVAGTGLTGGTITTNGTIALANTGVAAGTYTLSRVVVDAQGRITSAADGSAVTNVVAGTGMTGGSITAAGTIGLNNTGVSAGTYTVSTIVVDAQGRITSALSGVASAAGVLSVTGGIGLTGGTITETGTLGLNNTGVTAGTYTLSTISVDAQGRITAAASGHVDVGGTPPEEIPVNFIIFVMGSPTNGQTIMRYQVKEPFTLIPVADDCIAMAETNPTAETVFLLYKNNDQVGTFTFGSGNAMGFYDSATDVTFLEDDIFSLVAPATADATIANIGFTFKGVRVNTEVPQSFVVYVQGVPVSNQILFRYQVKEEFVIRASPIIGCVAIAETAGLTDQVYTIRKNDSENVGQFSFTAGQNSIYLTTGGSDATFNDGDIFSLIAPDTVDPNMSNLGFTFIGERL